MTEDLGGRPMLEGRNVLIVEDRYLIAAELADGVRRLGGHVLGPSPSLAAAYAMIDQDVHLGLLDVNLDGELVFPLAEALVARGVPILFLTGYEVDTLPFRWRDAPRLTKPITDDGLSDALQNL